MKVLRAGITQSLKSGKNKIVIELTEPTTIPPEVLRELGRFRLLANELSGDIVLSGMSGELRTKVESFSTPPFTICYEKLDQALEHFKKSVKPVSAAPPPAAATATAAADAEKAAQQKIVTEEGGEIGKLRRELDRLKKENDSLAKLLAKKFFDRHEPEDVQGYQAKVKDLEERLAEILEKPPEKPKTGQAKPA